MIKYVIWDFNGTILDDRDLSLDLLNELLIKEDKEPINMEQYLEVFGFPIVDYYKKAGITFKYETFEEMAIWFIEVYQPASLKLKLIQNVEKTLIELNNKGIKNICLSASETNNLTEQLNHYNISKHFKKILGTTNIHALGKRDVGLNYLKENNIDPKTCLLIGDTIEDYKVAKHLGVKPVLFSGGHQSKKRLKKATDLIIDDVNDILKLI